MTSYTESLFAPSKYVLPENPKPEDVLPFSCRKIRGKRLRKKVLNAVQNYEGWYALKFIKKHVYNEYVLKTIWVMIDNQTILKVDREYINKGIQVLLDQRES